jgi:hypothetical protein
MFLELRRFHMPLTWPTLGKYLIGMGASLLIFLAGGWLILAPFALVGFVFFFASLLGALRAAGVLAAGKPAEQAQAALQPQTALALVPATDLSARRQAGSDQAGDQSIEQVVTRREA